MTTTAEPTTITTIPAPALLRAMKNACLFASPDTTLPVLHAVRIEAAGGQLTIDATDRYKLLRQTLDVADELNIPSATVALPNAKRLCRELDGALKAIPVRQRGGDAVAVHISSDSSALRLQLWRDDTVYTYPLPDLGQFPEIGRLLDNGLEPTDDPFVLGAEHLSAFASCRISDKVLRWKITSHGNGKPTHWRCTDEAARHELHGLLMAVNT